MTDFTIQTALNDFNKNFSQQLTRYLERYIGDRAVAEELRQETMLKISKNLESFAGNSSFKTWAFSIASRVAADYLRHPERRVHIIEFEEAGDLVDPDISNDEMMIIDEMNLCIRQVISSLPAPYRTALILHDIEGFSAEETAEICDSSIASAKIRIHRARAKLKDALKSRCGFYRDTNGVFRCDRK